jgi:ADP-ribose pyrophosphatase YjhB (NUDIX family)
MKTAEKIAYWSDIVRDISAGGIKYAENVYDRDRYQALQDLAIEMLAEATGSELEELEPLREPIFSRYTPMTVADAAIIDPSGRMLMIKRADNETWAMPGGYLEVGETPAEGAVREAHEETGVRCRPLRLVGLYDSRICGSLSGHHLYMTTVLCEPIFAATEEPSHGHEVLDHGWFEEKDLPPNLCPGHEIRSRDAFRIWRDEGHPHLDV